MHRYGTLKPGNNIVLVATASEHREAAFEAARFLMDYLKTRAPFWKREDGPSGPRWVEAEARDEGPRPRAGTRSRPLSSASATGYRLMMRAPRGSTFT